MRNFGFTDYDGGGALGTNGKMSEASAAMGLTSLEAADEFIAVNRRNYLTYRRDLVAVPGLTSWSTPKPSTTTTNTSSSRSTERAGLQSRPPPAAAQGGEHWRSPVLLRAAIAWSLTARCPATAVSTCPPRTPSPRVLCLPTGTAVDVEAVEAICDVIKSAVRHGPESRAGLGTVTRVTPRDQRLFSVWLLGSPMASPLPESRYRRVSQGRELVGQPGVISLSQGTHLPVLTHPPSRLRQSRTGGNRAP
jgi:hypothetical protein